MVQGWMALKGAMNKPRFGHGIGEYNNLDQGLRGRLVDRTQGGVRPMH